MSRLRLVPLLALLPVLALAACGGGGDEGGSASACKDVDAPASESRHAPKPTSTLDPSKTYEITMETSCGSFTFRVDQEQSPNAAASMVALVKDGFYDNTIFHRIVPEFVIQGGDPTQTGTDGPGYTTLDTPPNDASYVKGTVAMAKTQAQPPGTSGSQFFVCTGASAAQLTPDYAVLGHVVKGQGVVALIGRLGNPATEQPTRLIEIEHATVSVH